MLENGFNVVFFNPSDGNKGERDIVDNIIKIGESYGALGMNFGLGGKEGTNTNVVNNAILIRLLGLFWAVGRKPNDTTSNETSHDSWGEIILSYVNAIGIACESKIKRIIDNKDLAVFSGDFPNFKAFLVL